MIRVSSIFSQMLHLFSRQEFERVVAVAERRAERHARNCWAAAARSPARTDSASRTNC